MPSESSKKRIASNRRTPEAKAPGNLWELMASLITRRKPKPGSKPDAAPLERRAAITLQSQPKPGPQPAAEPSKPLRADPAKPTKADLYEQVTRAMLAQYGIRVRKWRTSMSGCAWTVTYRDGTVSRLIESPKPKGPMSAAVFLHEIGHHAIGFDVYKPRCLEEYHAWRWSLEAMEANGIAVTDRVRQRMADSLAYAVAKAKRRGIKRIPPELVPFDR